MKLIQVGNVTLTKIPGHGYNLIIDDKEIGEFDSAAFFDLISVMLAAREVTRQE